MNWTELILPIVLACIAAIPGIISLFRGRSKERADVATAITQAARELVEEYQAQIEKIEITVKEQAELIRCQEHKLESQAIKAARQQLEINKLKEEQEEFLEGVTALCAQIRSLGHEPVWEPEK